MSPGNVESKFQAAARSNDIATLASLFERQNFTLVDTAPDGADGSNPMFTPVDNIDRPAEGYQALVAFTSDELLSDFADSLPQHQDENGAVGATMMPGPDLLAWLPEQFGIVINPGPTLAVLPPDTVAQLKRWFEPA
jgi:hypothetical protein